MTRELRWLSSKFWSSRAAVVTLVCTNLLPSSRTLFSNLLRINLTACNDSFDRSVGGRFLRTNFAAAFNFSLPLG
ncbi:uncharacterized protein F5891DRAFT_1046729 [Suillus fuscotomentosus]|uniref:Uncharacterized protein n=1 Tax=Suillus fuscotomentosus TaxID=1912939 RepID=A0AAD4HJM9_9AGAM|nr:uncharacterized protein F5891DRAFT_1046729 [Suillus fuscotomentosus]KAG1897914.1 hypothetical protein F5891DRAFT_1046729 [Suillus fuscotomentosus]